MRPRPGSKPTSPGDGADLGDDRRRVGPAQGAELGAEPFPVSPDGRFRWFDQQLAVVSPDVETQEIVPIVDVHDLGLFLVEGQAPGCQPSGDRGFDLLGLPLAVAERDQIIGIADNHR